ncbi:MAG: NAD-dependent deacylase [Cytophagales bacterium]|nr:MAG: NAD-dependent deacylase [Cytophagales bacterium]
MKKPKIVVLTGAGISAESGIKTFRDAGGLWEGHDIMEVASPEGFMRNPQLVLDFYNQRRRQLSEVNPNAAHFALKKLETKFDVQIITQNVDDLHERSGSKKIIHLHGELTKARSSIYPKLVYEIGVKDIHIGDTCEKGFQLRPFIVWFGENVPLMEKAVDIASKADIFIIIGTSMQVYPAAGLINYVQKDALIYLIDPQIPDIAPRENLHCIQKSAVEGLPNLVDELLE